MQGKATERTRGRRNKWYPLSRHSKEGKGWRWVEPAGQIPGIRNEEDNNGIGERRDGGKQGDEGRKERGLTNKKEDGGHKRPNYQNGEPTLS